VIAVITKARKMALPTVWLAVRPKRIIKMGTTRTPPPMAVAPTSAPQMAPMSAASVLRSLGF
jgi:hypothetical protein